MSPLFKKLSISAKLYVIVGIMAFLICLELFLLWFTIDALSSVRAFVGGEGLWSKSQKDAAYAINQYSHSHNEADYVTFLNFIKVPLGDKKARIELLKQKSDLGLVYSGFNEGRNHHDDMAGMTRLIKRFNGIYYIHKALEIWAEGDVMIAQMINNAEQLHHIINSKGNNDRDIETLNKHITFINAQITVLEDNFSYTLGEGSRWLENLVLKLLVITAIMVELTGLLMSIALSKSITKGIGAITSAADEVIKGNYSSRAIVKTNDELGELAAEFNYMTVTLENKIQELKQEEQQREALLKDIKETNQELRSFAYVVSHDLKSPLRGIITIADWLKKDYADKLDEQGREYLDLISNRTMRMNDLIDGILQYSRASSSKAEKILIDTKVLLDELIETLSSPAHIKIEVNGYFPVVKYEKVKLTQIFQNLISNAIKYIDTPQGLITIDCIEMPMYWQFSVADNGIGIEEKYFSKIFDIFQTLSDKEEADSTGIGLSIVKKIVENSNGKIWLTSIPSEGTTFYFTISKVV